MSLAQPFQPIPIVGSQVLYVLPHHTPRAGEVRPAVVTRVWNTDYNASTPCMCNLNVFCDQSDDFPDRRDAANVMVGSVGVFVPDLQIDISNPLPDPAPGKWLFNPLVGILEVEGEQVDFADGEDPGKTNVIVDDGDDSEATDPSADKSPEPEDPPADK